MTASSRDSSSGSEHAASAERHPAPHRGTASGARLWLVRHAEVAAEWRGKAYGDLDVPLSPEGESRTLELARDLADLPPSALLSSPLQRARKLAAAIASRADVRATEAAGLREIHRGAWQGLAVDRLHEQHADAVAAFYKDPWSWRGHGGEADQDVAARAWPPIERALSESHETIVVTTHYNVLRVLAASALGLAPARSFALRVDTGRAVLLVDGMTGWELASANTYRPGSGS